MGLFGKSRDDPDLIISLMDKFNGVADKAYKAYVSTHPDTRMSVTDFEEMWDNELDLRAELQFYEKYERGDTE